MATFAQQFQIAAPLFALVLIGYLLSRWGRWSKEVSAALSKVLQDKGVIEKFDAMGAEARGTTPEEFQAYLQREYDKWAPVIKRANIKAD